MDKKEAKQILQKELLALRDRPYSDLLVMASQEPFTNERIGQSGKSYQIEIQVFPDDKTSGNLRVMGSIDDGGLRAFFPISDDFIKNPLNEFIGE